MPYVRQREFEAYKALASWVAGELAGDEDEDVQDRLGLTHDDIDNLTIGRRLERETRNE